MNLDTPTGFHGGGPVSRYQGGGRRGRRVGPRLLHENLIGERRDQQRMGEGNSFHHRTLGLPGGDRNLDEGVVIFGFFAREKVDFWVFLNFLAQVTRGRQGRSEDSLIKFFST